MPSYVNIGAYVDEGSMVDTGRPSVPARRSAKTSTCPAASVSVAYWSRCRLTRPLSKITALSARVPKSLRALSSKRVPLSLWACTSARAPKSTIAKPVKCSTAAFRQAPSSSPATCRQKMANTACTARSLSKSRCQNPRQGWNQRTSAYHRLSSMKSGRHPAFLYIKLAKIDFSLIIQRLR